MKKILLAFALFIVTATINAQTAYVWKGGVDNKWSTLANWESPAGTPATQVPGIGGNEGVDVAISSSSTGEVIVNIGSGESYMINKLVITANANKATLNILSSGVLNINLTTIGTSTTACLIAGAKISNAGSLLFSTTSGSLSNGLVRFTSGTAISDDSWLENKGGGFIDFNSSSNTNVVNAFSFGQTGGFGTAKITNEGAFNITPNTSTTNNYFFTVTSGDALISGVKFTLGASGAGTLGGLISISPSSSISAPVNVTLASNDTFNVFNGSVNPIAITGVAASTVNVNFTNNGFISITPQVNTTTTATYGININPGTTSGATYTFTNTGTINLKGAFQNSSSMGIIRMFAPTPNAIVLNNSGTLDIENTNTGTTASGAIYGNSSNTSNYTINNLSTGVFRARLTGTATNLDAITISGSATASPVFNNDGKVIVKGKIGGNAFGKFINNGELDASDNIVSNNTFIGATVPFVNNGLLKIGLANTTLAATNGAQGAFLTSTGTISPTSASSQYAITNLVGASLAPSTKVALEIGGNRSTTLWDRIAFTSTNTQVDLTNMVFNLSLVSGYTPVANDSVVFVTASAGTSSLNGTPTVNLPSGWLYTKNTGNTQLIAYYPGVLPVTLSAFQATYTNGIVALSWATAIEVNNKGFYVEKSIDNSVWNQIGFVAAAGVASNYSFVDNNPSSVNYYRLKQVDVDGKATYSKVVIVKTVTADKVISIAPNPASNYVLLNVKNLTNGNVKTVATIYNAYGQKVAQKNITTATTSIDVSNLAVGTYYVEVMIDNIRYNQMFIKQ